MAVQSSALVSSQTPAADPQRTLRLITAASLFDGHDAAINVIRRILQAHGAEIVHLGHNRSVADIVRAAIQEDADGIAVSSYQGGHNEYFRYMVDQLRDNNAAHIKVVVGGGGTIAPHEIAELEAYGIEKIYTPDDGLRLGLDGMIEDVLQRVRASPRASFEFRKLTADDEQQLARSISMLEGGGENELPLRQLRQAIEKPPQRTVPVIGITGTGGAGKSSLTDELLSRFVRRFPERRIAVVAMDPTRRRSGGALLGDRIRMNTLANERIFMRSLATRRAHLATSEVLADTLALMKQAAFDLIVVETAGIGQSDTEIVDLADVSLYVMTSDYGAASQLEKIDMLDFADCIAINKFEKRGAQDALRDVRKQWRRNHPQSKDAADADVPVYPTIASQFNDPGVNRLFDALCRQLTVNNAAFGDWINVGRAPDPAPGSNLSPASLSDNSLSELPTSKALIPGPRVRYLAEIAGQGRDATADLQQRAEAASEAHGLYRALQALPDPKLPAPLDRYAHRYPAEHLQNDSDLSLQKLRSAYHERLDRIGAEGIELLKGWPQRADATRQDQYTYNVRNRTVTGDNYSTTLSHQKVPKVAVPQFRDWGDTLHFLLAENLPGHFPYTGGLYPYRREDEDPLRMFAGEGTPERTNRRFHYVAGGHGAARLSTAFDSTTLYGEDPDERPDIYGRIGNSGVSIATLDDMKKLYSGFDLCSPSTSVSMTINGPAPMILAMFMNTAIDQRVEAYLKKNGRWDEAQAKIVALFEQSGHERPRYKGDLPEGNDGFGLGLLGVTGDQVLEAEIYEKLRAEALAAVRGTVQADILKEEQAQNTCIFSTEFAMRMMGDVQAFFIDHAIRNFYSISISGYHIAEAGANPVTQLAFTLANGFTIVEYYLARGMRIDDFAPNLSFFFSNGMDAEYAVIGRVARRIWARAMRHLYKASSRSQMLKYHVQTSGRSLHAREIQFNDIRTTLQAMYALFDNCNSLHTNAYDEALTTPTEESVRRAVAIQLIINRELGLNKNQNPWQGSFLLEQLTDLVEEAVYQEFDRLSERGGVLGAMETMYQRSRIQEESLFYEKQKHDGSLPLIGVNTFLNESVDAAAEAGAAQLIRSTEEEKQDQVKNVHAFLARNAARRPAALKQLQAVAAGGGNVFAELMNTVKAASLGSISHALYEVGGQYRRSM